MTDHSCLSCGSPMQVAATIKTKATYRTRRFKCTVCDYSELICADGKIDLEWDAKGAIEQVAAMHRKQSELNSL